MFISWRAVAAIGGLCMLAAASSGLRPAGDEAGGRAAAQAAPPLNGSP